MVKNDVTLNLLFNMHPIHSHYAKNNRIYNPLKKHWTYFVVYHNHFDCHDLCGVSFIGQELCEILKSTYRSWINKQSPTYRRLT